MSTDTSVVTKPAAAESVPSEAVPLFIGGQTVEASSGRFGTVYHPSSGKAARRVGFASKADVARAIGAAAAAFPGWAAAPPLRRARILNRFRELIERDQAKLAAIITSEHGKVLSDAKGEVQRGSRSNSPPAFAPSEGRIQREVGTGVDTYSMRQPLGVVAGITPFNFPAMVPWMFPVALACGNTFVLKPSEKDPSASIELARLLKEAGLPDGSSTPCTATRKRWTLLDSPAIGRSASSVRHRSPSIYTRDGDRQTRAGARRCQESHGDPAGCRSRSDRGRRWARRRLRG